MREARSLSRSVQKINRCGLRPSKRVTLAVNTECAGPLVLLVCVVVKFSERAAGPLSQLGLLQDLIGLDHPLKLGLGRPVATV